MIEFDNTLYPLSNIKCITIDRDELTLIIYFMEGLGLFPKTLKYVCMRDLEKKVDELSGTKRKSLLG